MFIACSSNNLTTAARFVCIFNVNWLYSRRSRCLSSTSPVGNRPACANPASLYVTACAWATVVPGPISLCCAIIEALSAFSAAAVANTSAIGPFAVLTVLS